MFNVFKKKKSKTNGEVPVAEIPVLEVPDGCVLDIRVIGDSNVGKSSYITRITEGSFSDDPSLAILGGDCQIKILTIEGKEIKLQLWDSMGGIETDVLTDGIIAFYDVTNAATFANVQEQLRELGRYSNENVCKVLVGTKEDCSNSINQKDVDSFAASLKIPAFTCSAKNNTNINEPVERLVDSILRKMARKT